MKMSTKLSDFFIKVIDLLLLLSTLELHLHKTTTLTKQGVSGVATRLSVATDRVRQYRVERLSRREVSTFLSLLTIIIAQKDTFDG